MLMALLAAAVSDPAAVTTIATCREQAVATARVCEGQWRSMTYRLDADLKGTLRADDGGRSETWQVDCPYDVVHRSGACAIVAKGVMLLRTYDGRVALLWGDRNAERRERTIAFDGTRQASWTDKMSADDTARALTLLEQSRRATFGWRAARAKAMTTTTLNLAGFADVEAMLATIVQVAQRTHTPG